jgi:hypothetical protein
VPPTNTVVVVARVAVRDLSIAACSIRQDTANPLGQGNMRRSRCVQCPNDCACRRLIAFIQSAPADQFTRETRARRRLRLDTYGHCIGGCGGGGWCGCARLLMSVAVADVAPDRTRRRGAQRWRGEGPP